MEKIIKIKRGRIEEITQIIEFKAEKEEESIENNAYWEIALSLRSQPILTRTII